MTSAVYENSAKKKLKAGELVLCMAVNQMRSAEAPMIAARCGFDAIFIDLEHSATSLETAAIDLRGGAHRGHHADRARAVARSVSCRAHPRCRRAGRDAAARRERRRGARDREDPALPADGPALGVQHGPALGYRAIGQGEINAFLNEQELVIAMLETPQAVEHADEIAAVPGIDMVHIGALDVSNVMGIPAHYADPRMRAVFEKVASACKAHGKAMGVGGARGDRELQQYLIDLGVRYLTSGSDVGYLMAAARADVARHGRKTQGG